MNRPILAITMGDPAGIGAEITVKALACASVYERCRPLVIGERDILARALTITGLSDRLSVQAVTEPEQGAYRAGVINVLELGAMSADELRYGQVSAKCGEAAYRYVEKAIELAVARRVAATVTNPLCKEALQLSGRHYSGHTEIYAALTGTKRYAMLLADGDMMISHVSTHVSLREACDRVKQERVLEVIGLTDAAVRKLKGTKRPVIGVAGLNPHCGENGLFGSEEQTEILPAVRCAQAEGIDAQGPVPPDTVFSKLRGGWYDAVVAMYHDQGHIPMKLLGFRYNRALQKWDSMSGVNITLGLPVIRTSVDHGTAFDQAGKGGANEQSLQNAIDYAIRLSR